MTLEQDLTLTVDRLEGLLTQAHKDMQELRTKNLYLQEQLAGNTKRWTDLQRKYQGFRQKVANALAVE